MRVAGRREGLAATNKPPSPLSLRRGPKSRSVAQVKAQKQSGKQQQQKQQASEVRPLHGAEMTVSCAMGETLNANFCGSHLAQEVQTYLQRRVAEILVQMKSPSSSHHYDRHVIEIDELLRCDAPMGFTPTMVLAGVPDMLFVLSEAILQGHLLKISEVDSRSVRALTPVRMNPLQKMLNDTLLLTGASQLLPEHEDNKQSHFPSRDKCGRYPMMRSPSNTIVTAAGGDATDADILSYLPPLVYHSSPQQMMAMMNSNAVSAERRTRTVTNAHLLDATGTKNCSGDQTPRTRLPGGTSLRGSVCDNTLEGMQSLVGFVETSCRLKQEQQQHTQNTCNAEDTVQQEQQQQPPRAQVLHDIPSALQAMLYHCSLPLVYLTAEDHRQRAPAVRALASTMTLMLRTMHGEAKADSTGLLETCDNDVVSGRSSTEGSSRSRNSSGRSGNCRKECESDFTVLFPQKQARDIHFHIRYALLMSLHALLSHIEEEGLSDMNKHFAARDKQQYERYGDKELLDTQVITEIGGSSEPHHEQKQHVVDHLVSVTDPVQQAIGGSSSRSKRTQYIHRTVPLSMYNKAVAVDVSAPLIEHWALILHRSLPGNALLDAAGEPPSRSAEAKQVIDKWCIALEGEDDTMLIKTMYKAAAAAAAGAGRKLRMPEQDAEEIFLLLRICLYLSSYKHHARHLIRPTGGDSAASYTSLPVLLCLTMARCTEGDRCLPLCIECLWNLLDVLPEETAQAILGHTARNKSDGVQDFSVAQDKCMATCGESSPALLSASESLLYTFVQILLFGYRLSERELRNDFVVLVLMILQIDTRMLRERELAISLQDSLLKSSELLPQSTINAMSTIAIIVFDLVCGPELRKMGNTADVTQQSADLFQRYHTVLLPTPRAENMQFKLLGWRLLEVFHVWQTNRLSLRHLQKPQWRQVAKVDDPLVGDGVGKQHDLFPDVCAIGFIDVLLMYVDTMCSNKFVVAWTREEVLTLQKEAWCILLALVEVSVELPLLKGTSSRGWGRGASRDFVKGVIDEKMISRSAADQSDSNSDGDQGEEMGASVSSLERADDIFVAAGGIACVLRYIQETTVSDAEPMMCLAVRLLSVLSRHSVHCPRLLAVTTMSTTTGEPVPMLLVVALRVIRVYIQRAVEPAAAKPISRGLLTTTASGQKGLPKNITSVNNFRSSWQTTQNTVMEKFHLHKEGVVSMSPLATEGHGGGGGGGGGFPDFASVHVSLTLQTFEAINYSLSLLYNISVGDAAEVAATQQAFMSLGGIPLLLNVIRLWLSLESLPSSHTISDADLNERSKELLCAVLTCTQAFVLGNESVQRQFVREDGVHILLRVVSIFALDGPQQRRLQLRQQQEKSKKRSVSATHYIPHDGDDDDNDNGGDKRNPRHDDLSLGSLLTLLADLLENCAEAKEAFLQWSMCDQQVMGKMGDDDGRINATQLLLCLWKEDFALEVVASTTTTAREVPSPTHTNSQESCDAHGVEGGGGGSDGEDEEAASEPMAAAASKRREGALSTSGSAGTMSATGTTVPHADHFWGLQHLGLCGRESVIEELRSRFLELRHWESLAGGVPPPDEATRGARERLADSLCRMLGLRVRVYACLAAVGFDTLANVKASAIERTKLLHIAALPSMCEDEVWGAIFESVRLHSHPLVVAGSKDKNVSMGADIGVGDIAVGAGESTRKFLVTPIAPDADQLVKVFHGVDARATEMRRLVRICVDMHMSYKEEEMSRFLLSRLRQGNNDADLAALVARSCHTSAVTFTTATATGGTVSATGNSNGVVDHVMGCIRSERVCAKPPCSFPPLPAGALTENGSVCTASAAPLTMLQKRRKRELMLKNTLRTDRASSANDSTTVVNTM